MSYEAGDSNNHHTHHQSETSREKWIILEWFLGTTYEQREAKDQCNKFIENLKQYILRVFHNPEDIIVLIRDLKYPTIGFNASRPTALSAEGEKEPIMVMIQTEEINKFVKKVNPTEKHNQDLWDNLRTLLPSNLERIGGRPIIYHHFLDIQLPLAVHQVQDVYICNLPYIKWLLFLSHGNENLVLSDTSKR